MGRREFLEILRGQLSGQMAQGKAAAHVRYYEDYIQSQVRSGRSETDVLAELGDPRLIARTLIDTDDGTEVMMNQGMQRRATALMTMQKTVPEIQPVGLKATDWILAHGTEKQL